MSNDSSIIDIESLELESVTGGQRVPPPGGLSGAGVLPIQLPTTSFSTTSSQPKCPPWRAWQGQSNIGILTNGTPAIVPTLHCPMYRPSSNGK